jgi:hypothetical protein
LAPRCLRRAPLQVLFSVERSLMCVERAAEGDVGGGELSLRPLVHSLSIENLIAAFIAVLLEKK